AIETPREADKPADVWSIGAMMFHLITGTRPYGTGFMAIHRIIEAKPITFPRFLTQNKQFSPLSEQIIEITKRCLTKEPKERPTADELVEFC
ncbi:protein kinase domain-containing protein, partial [Streptococcus suis]